MSQRVPVAATGCNTYEPAHVGAALARLFVRLGAIERWIRPGMRVALKPNLVMAKAPEKAVTTHPQVVEAVAKAVLAVGAVPVIIDSPGGPAGRGGAGLRAVYEQTGMADVGRRLGVEVSDDVTTVEVPLDEGSPLRRVTLLKALVEADAIINLPKIKTHAQMGYTGAVKNLYGAIPGMIKAEYHFRVQDPGAFARLIIALNERLRPVLTIMDGIMGMEGDGPTAGAPKQLGCLLASTSTYALDRVALGLIGLTGIATDMVAEAEGRIGMPEMVTDGERIRTVPFVPARNGELNFAAQWLPSAMANWVSRQVRPLPVFDPKKCVSCGVCVISCPATALILKEVPGAVPKLDKGNCIGCLCCQELCPEGAVAVRRSGMGSLLFAR
ncbi:DUF362 domain-containing protein [Heliophilum fasciatum]|uniref:Ferredoxin n=1 Tax=Heliophilum fasciatum TaxID=35700 RepID=A0A4R2RG96_9FIRM|nr:DUF362 domain-containing protein [Heliophilum fasciatum]MCW2278606.1 uncharacterized protein (DUF362 family)/ferredoxin [Heliophilum fasciatum]TCP62692.1 uncharacterized protein (DUF362 family) [Heliophilum fasciatum]